MPLSLNREGELIQKIEVKSYRDKSRLLDSRDLEPPKNNIVTLSHYDFDHLLEGCTNEKLSSSQPIFKAILFLRNQDKTGRDYYGEQQPFLPDQQYINLRDIKHEIGDIRLLLE